MKAVYCCRCGGIIGSYDSGVYAKPCPIRCKGCIEERLKLMDKRPTLTEEESREQYEGHFEIEKEKE